MMEQLDFNIPITWPRRVMAGKNHQVFMGTSWHYGQFLVESLNEFAQVVNAASNVDIFIHTHSEQNLKNGYIENLLMDFDSESDIDLARKAAMKVSTTIKRFFDVVPLVYFSGHKGFHVVLPFRQVPLPGGANELGPFLSFMAKTIIKGAKLSKDPTVDWQVVNSPLRFMRLIGSYHSGDPMHKVEMTQPWDGNLAESRLLYGSFRIAQVIEQNRLRKVAKSAKPPDKTGYEWINELMKHPISDGRHRTLWLIIAPYLINVARFSFEYAYRTAQSYYMKCNTLHPLTPSEFEFTRAITYFLERAVHNGYRPLQLETIKAKDPQLYEIIQEVVQP